MSRIQIDQIETDGTQSRSTMDPATIDEYASAMQSGSQFPPVIVFSEGNGYWLADGFHRLAATIATGEDSIEADVRQGGKRDAILYSVGANSAHGLRRTNEDKRRSVLRLLEDEEWGGWSDREIARRCNVGHPLVSSLRENHTGISSSMERTFIHHKTGQPATMQTGNIGKSYGRCAKCNRPLTDPGSIAAGVGPCCATHNHVGNGNGQGAEFDSDTEAQFVTAAWDIPIEQTVDDLPVYGMSDDDVDVVYARGNRTHIPDEEDASLPVPMETRNKLAVHFSSDHDSHYTPDPIWQAAQRVMGGIDLDPCSNSHAQPNIPASRHYTAEDDGLRQVWQGSIFLNPPYGSGIGEWIAKLVEAHAAGDVPQAIALIPARVDTRWWQMIRDYSVCFVKGRLTFKNNDSGAPFPSAIVYLGRHTDKFIQEFDHIGDIWRRIHA